MKPVAFFMLGVCAWLILPAAPAQAGADDTWSEAAVSEELSAAHRTYEQAMLDGDRALDLAVAETNIAASRSTYVRRAVDAYERAARALPTAAEPHFRASSALHAFFVECAGERDPNDPAALCRGTLPPAIVSRLLGHWKAFEAKAPLDPRFTDDILFARAILYTKQATPDALSHARDDYRAILAQRTVDRSAVLVLGNLAETEMMLGDLDASIATYRRVLEIDQRKENYFGLAVALDRDEQGEEARAVLRSLGFDAVRYLDERIREGDVFYVPHGEAYYYLALGFEANGLVDEAAQLYDLFIRSGAHPRYAARAKANHDALTARRSRKK